MRVCAKQDAALGNLVGGSGYFILRSCIHSRGMAHRLRTLQTERQVELYPLRWRMGRWAGKSGRGCKITWDSRCKRCPEFR
jgi:hypothetical protein